MRWFTYPVACLLALAGSASAAQGEFCMAAEQNAPAGLMKLSNDSTVFQCKSLGQVTFPQLYAKGWKVVSVFPQSSMDSSKPGMASVLWTLVVEKG